MTHFGKLGVPLSDGLLHLRQTQCLLRTPKFALCLRQLILLPLQRLAVLPRILTKRTNVGLWQHTKATQAENYDSVNTWLQPIGMPWIHWDLGQQHVWHSFCFCLTMSFTFSLL